MTQFLYDHLNPVQELDAGGGVTANILTGLGIDTFLRRTTGPGGAGVARSVFADALGSTVALTDETGTLQTQYRYGPFGQATVVAGSPPDTNPFQFTGREADGTGLYYYRARYYNPTWGRFVSEDPAGFYRYPAGSQVARWQRVFGGNRLPGLIHRRPGQMRYLPSFYAYAEDNPLRFTDPLGLLPQCSSGSHLEFDPDAFLACLGDRLDPESLIGCAGAIALTGTVPNPVSIVAFIGTCGRESFLVGVCISEACACWAPYP